MENIIHADIFFFVSTIAVGLITIVLVIALIYVIRILRTISKVSEKVKDEGEEIMADIKALRGSIKQQGFGMRNVLSVMKMVFGRKKGKKD